MCERDGKSSGQLDVWRVKCVLSSKNHRWKKWQALLKG